MSIAACRPEFETPSEEVQYVDARMRYAVLESVLAGQTADMDACVENYDARIGSPKGIGNLLIAWEKFFNEILQAKTRAELLHHYAQLQRVATGLHVAVDTAFWEQYKHYHAPGEQRPADAAEAAESVRRAFDVVSAVPNGV